MQLPKWHPAFSASHRLTDSQTFGLPVSSDRHQQIPRSLAVIASIPCRTQNHNDCSATLAGHSWIRERVIHVALQSVMLIEQDGQTTEVPIGSTMNLLAR